MKRVRFDYEVFAVLHLSASEVAMLSELCAHHYDAGVRALTLPGPNAVLFAARHDLLRGESAADRESCTVRVSHRQLDRLCKATEGSAHVRLHEELQKLLRESSAASLEALLRRRGS